MRGNILRLSIAIAIGIAYPAGAVLKHYRVHWTTIQEFNITLPNPDFFPPGSEPFSLDGPQAPLLQTLDNKTDVSSAIIDDSNNGSPVLKRLTLLSEMETTVDVPSVSGFLFSSVRAQSGPKQGTGTGGTQQTIAWGVVTGWTTTGNFYCHSSIAFVCTYAEGSDLNTVAPSFYSSFYDLGTWVFHGTGFTSVPFVINRPGILVNAVGNYQYRLRGGIAGGLVPALPVLGVALLGASLLFAGARLSRKR